jgi:hypothetical protein
MTVGDLRNALAKARDNQKLVVYSFGTDRPVVSINAMPSGEKIILVLGTTR